MKLAALAAAILVLLCSCSGVAARLPQSILALRLDLRAPSADWLRSRLTEKLLGRDVKLAPGATAGCAVETDRLIVPAGASCNFSLPASSRRARQLRLALSPDASGGDSVAVRLVQQVQDKPLTADQALREGDDPMPVDVYRCEPKSDSPFAPDVCAKEGQRAAILTLHACTPAQLPEQLKELQSNTCEVEIKN